MSNVHNQGFKITGNTTFIRNTGGGITVFDSSGSIDGIVSFIHNSKAQIGQLTLLASTVTVNGTIRFDNNSALNGGALYTIASRIHIFGNCTVQNNYVIDTGGGLAGAMSLLVSEVSFSGYFHLVNNRARNMGGAIHLVSSNLSFHGSFTFWNNTAKQGGALSLEYNSKLIFKQDTDLSFQDNKADVGACIYVRDFLTSIDCTEDSTTIEVARSKLRSDCMFNTNIPRNVKINATGNVATTGGNILYGGILQPVSYTHLTLPTIYSV